MQLPFNLPDATFLGNTLEDWLLALGVALATLLGLWIIQRFVLGRLRRVVSFTSSNIDDLILISISQYTKFGLLVLLSLFAGSLLLTFSPLVKGWLSAAAIFVFLIQLGIWGNAIIRMWSDEYAVANLEQAADAVTTMRAVTFVLRLALYSLLALIAIDNIPGVEVTALIASLGIGGIAVALAVQNILGDLFSSLTIALDKPFIIGDFIKVGDYLGSVEEIGLKTTRIRSLTGEQLVFSNSDLLNSRLQNFGEMWERRVAFEIGVTYQTPAAKLRQIPEMMREYVLAQAETRFDRAHLKAFGDSALVYEIVYFVLSPDYNLYMDVQQAINLALIERFAREGIEFAYPTQTLYVTQEALAQPNGSDGQRRQAKAAQS